MSEKKEKKIHGFYKCAVQNVEIHETSKSVIIMANISFVPPSKYLGIMFIYEKGNKTFKIFNREQKLD